MYMPIIQCTMNSQDEEDELISSAPKSKNLRLCIP